MKTKSDYFPRGLSVMNNQWYLDTCTCLWLKQTKNIKICAKFILLHVWLLVFIHIYIYPLFTSTLTFTWKESVRQSQVCVKGRGHLFFAKKNVFNKKLLFFWLLFQYTWSGILNLIKIIHVPQSITMRVTPPCVPPYVCVAYCVSLCFCLAYCLPFYNNSTIFGNFFDIKKIKWQYVACTCTIILANVNFGVFAC